MDVSQRDKYFLQCCCHSLKSVFFVDSTSCRTYLLGPIGVSGASLALTMPPQASLPPSLAICIHHLLFFGHQYDVHTAASLQYKIDMLSCRNLAMRRAARLEMLSAACRVCVASCKLPSVKLPFGHPGNGLKI